MDFDLSWVVKWIERSQCYFFFIHSSIVWTSCIRPSQVMLITNTVQITNVFSDKNSSKQLALVSIRGQLGTLASSSQQNLEWWSRHFLWCWWSSGTRKESCGRYYTLWRVSSISIWICSARMPFTAQQNHKQARKCNTVTESTDDTHDASAFQIPIRYKLTVISLVACVCTLKN